MLKVKSHNTNIQFYGRNKEIINAQQILHKIKSEYPASSPYVADLLAQKRELKRGQSNVFIGISEMIEHYYCTENIGAKVTNNNLFSLRRVQKHYIDDDYRYCDSLIWGIKNLRAMNCKENSELAFLIAKINGYKNCHCVNLAQRLSDSSIKDLDHTVLLINQYLPHNINKLNKFYSQSMDISSVIVPTRKSIVVDPLFGIVDYWENAIQNYKIIFPQLSNTKEICIGVRDAIITKQKDIKKMRFIHPELIITHFVKKEKNNIFNKIINYLHLNN